MSRAFDETYQFPLLRVFIWMDKVLGPADTMSLLNIMWGWMTISPHG